MYRCDLCQVVAPPKARSYPLVVRTRVKHYPEREKVNRRISLAKGRLKGELADDPGGVGREIVKELRVCAECHAGSTTA